MRTLITFLDRHTRKFAVSTAMALALLLNVGAIGSMLMLGACANQTEDQLKTDVSIIANGLSGVVAALQALPANIAPSADIIAKIQTEIAIVQSNAAVIATSLTPSTATLQAIAGGISTIAALATPFFPAAPAIAAVVQAAVSLIGIVLNTAGVAIPQASARTFAAIPQFSGDQARAILIAAAAK